MPPKYAIDFFHTSLSTVLRQMSSHVVFIVSISFHTVSFEVDQDPFHQESRACPYSSSEVFHALHMTKPALMDC